MPDFRDEAEKLYWEIDQARLSHGNIQVCFTMIESFAQRIWNSAIEAGIEKQGGRYGAAATKDLQVLKRKEGE
jgi:hypothetical protein